jgi:hypothetical protein
VDQDYDLDNLDKDAVFNVPPVPVGTVDTAWFTGDMTGIPGWVEIPGVDGTITMEHVLDNLFTEDIISKFFFDGAASASLEGKVDIDIASFSPDASLTMQLGILGDDGEVISDIELNSMALTNTKGQNFLLQINREDMIKMATARGVKITLVFENLDDFHLTRDDYLLLKNLVLKTGGMHLDL